MCEAMSLGEVTGALREEYEREGDLVTLDWK